MVVKEHLVGLVNIRHSIILTSPSWLFTSTTSTFCLLVMLGTLRQSFNLEAKKDNLLLSILADHRFWVDLSIPSQCFANLNTVSLSISQSYGSYLCIYKAAARTLHLFGQCQKDPRKKYCCK